MPHRFSLVPWLLCKQTAKPPQPLSSFSCEDFCLFVSTEGKSPSLRHCLMVFLSLSTSVTPELETGVPPPWMGGDHVILCPAAHHCGNIPQAAQNILVSCFVWSWGEILVNTAWEEELNRERMRLRNGCVKRQVEWSQGASEQHSNAHLSLTAGGRRRSPAQGASACGTEPGTLPPGADRQHRAPGCMCPQVPTEALTPWYGCGYMVCLSLTLGPRTREQLMPMPLTPSPSQKVSFYVPGKIILLCTSHDFSAPGRV